MRQAERAPRWEPDRHRSSRGLTLLEVLITFAIVGILAAIAAQAYGGALDRARFTRATADIRVAEKILATMEVEDELPAALDEIGWGDRDDPWGRPYQYLRFAGAEDLPGKARKDHFLVPLNTTFDLYSTGPDGASEGPLSANASRDDVVRAGDGAFVGQATDF